VSGPGAGPADALPFTCPVCTRKLSASLSLAMRLGLNSGSGSCTNCRTFLHLEVLPGGHAMSAIQHLEYLRKRVSGLELGDSRRLLYRAEWLADQVHRHGWSLLRAVRYALKQGRHQESFLSRLTFMPGSGAAMREAAVYLRDQVRRQPSLYAMYREDRAALLNDWAQKCGPDREHG
jgi:hypothetical protein